jgi:trimeric autotransporter adhesin
MICFPHRRPSRLVLALMFLASASLAGQTQTPGLITKFGSSPTDRDCGHQANAEGQERRERERCELRVVDSVIAEDPSGNIGIGTTTPASALDVASGDVNLAGNILKGGQLFLHNLGGVQNTFIGIRAGNSTNGDSNTGVGFEALEYNTAGVFNTAIGQRALEQNTTGVDNTANGNFALANNTIGGFNTAIGNASLFSNTTGFFNTASGAYALLSNTTGYWNTATGFYALQANTDGFNNTASGPYALYNTTGSNNTAIGTSALFSNTTGVANTAIGAFADVSAPNLTNATAIGAGAIVDASNKIRFGNSQVTVIEGQVPYTFVSDRNQKENFHAVDGEAVLKKVGGLNLTSWNYIGHNPQQFRHYGPVAQEFFAAFGQDAVGTIGTPTTINSGDLEGILMVAVQALEKRTAENADLRARIEALEKLVRAITTEER